MLRDPGLHHRPTARVLLECASYVIHSPDCACAIALHKEYRLERAVWAVVNLSQFRRIAEDSRPEVTSSRPYPRVSGRRAVSDRGRCALTLGRAMCYRSPLSGMVWCFPHLQTAISILQRRIFWMFLMNLAQHLRCQLALWLLRGTKRCLVASELCAFHRRLSGQGRLEIAYQEGFRAITGSVKMLQGWKRLLKAVHDLLKICHWQAGIRRSALILTCP